MCDRSFNWLKFVLHIAQITPLFTSTFFPIEHEFYAAVKYQITLETLEECLTACFEEDDCALVNYDKAKGACTVFIEGNDVQQPSDALFGIKRYVTDFSCESSITIAKEVAFNSIEAKPSDDSKKCKGNPDAQTAVYVYRNEGSLHFYSTISSGFLQDGSKPIRRFLFTRNPEPQCTAVPVFIRANHRRLFFGYVYNTTGYYFLNAYVYAEYCVCSSGTCCGVKEFREHIRDAKDYVYRTNYTKGEPQAESLSNSLSIAQHFFMADVTGNPNKVPE